MDRSMSGWIRGYVDRWKDGWLSGKVDGWIIDGWMTKDGWMMDKQHVIHPCSGILRGHEKE